MQLAVSNGLPDAKFRLLDSNDNKVLCRFHLYSCAIINSGNLLVHQWLMKKYPEIVHSYEQLDNSNPFEPIMLKGSLNMESAKAFEAGKLTATLTYNTPYIHSNVEPVFITFGLGETFSVNAIIVLPTLTS